MCQPREIPEQPELTYLFLGCHRKKKKTLSAKTSPLLLVRSLTSAPFSRRRLYSRDCIRYFVLFFSSSLLRCRPITAMASSSATDQVDADNIQLVGLQADGRQPTVHMQNPLHDDLALRTGNSQDSYVVSSGAPLDGKSLSPTSGAAASSPRKPSVFSGSLLRKMGGSARAVSGCSLPPGVHNLTS